LLLENGFPQNSVSKQLTLLVCSLPAVQVSQLSFCVWRAAVVWATMQVLTPLGAESAWDVFFSWPCDSQAKCQDHV
jgi:hypothetical protein